MAEKKTAWDYLPAETYSNLHPHIKTYIKDSGWDFMQNPANGEKILRFDREAKEKDRAWHIKEGKELPAYLQPVTPKEKPAPVRAQAEKLAAVNEQVSPPKQPKKEVKKEKPFVLVRDPDEKPQPVKEDKYDKQMNQGYQDSISKSLERLKELRGIRGFTDEMVADIERHIQGKMLQVANDKTLTNVQKIERFSDLQSKVYKAMSAAWKGEYTTTDQFKNAIASLPSENATASSAEGVSDVPVAGDVPAQPTKPRQPTAKEKAYQNIAETLGMSGKLTTSAVFNAAEKKFPGIYQEGMGFDDLAAKVAERVKQEEADRLSKADAYAEMAEATGYTGDPTDHAAILVHVEKTVPGKDGGFVTKLGDDPNRLLGRVREWRKENKPPAEVRDEGSPGLDESAEKEGDKQTQREGNLQETAGAVASDPDVPPNKKKEAVSDAQTVAKLTRDAPEIGDRVDEVRAKRQEYVDKRNRTIEQALRAMEGGGINPNRVWENTSALKAVGLMFASFMSSYGARATGRGDPNAVWKMYSNAVDRDIQAQKATYEKQIKTANAKNNLYGAMIKSLERDENIELQMKRFYIENDLAQLQMQLKTAKTPVEKERAQILLDTLKLKAEKYRKELEVQDRLQDLKIQREEAEIEYKKAQTAKLRGGSGATASYHNVRFRDGAGNLVRQSPVPLSKDSQKRIREASDKADIVLQDLDYLTGKMMNIYKKRNGDLSTTEKIWGWVADQSSQNVVLRKTDIQELKSAITAFKATYGTEKFKGALQPAEMRLLDQIIGNPEALGNPQILRQLREVALGVMRNSTSMIKNDGGVISWSGKYMNNLATQEQDYFTPED